MIKNAYFKLKKKSIRTSLVRLEEELEGGDDHDDESDDCQESITAGSC